VCITINQADTKSYSNPNQTTKRHAIVSIQRNIVASPTYAEKFIRDNVIAPFLLLSDLVVILSCKDVQPISKAVYRGGFREKRQTVCNAGSILDLLRRGPTC